MTETADLLAPLFELRSKVEAADSAWFEALRGGYTVAAAEAKATHKDALAAYRAVEGDLIARGVTETCGKCGGDRVVHYGRVIVTKVTRSGKEMNDRWCFECGGSGSVPVRKHRFSATAPTRLKRVLAREAEEAAEEAAGDERWAAFEAANPEVARFVALHGGDNFLVSMEASIRKFGSLTEKQTAAVERSIARDKAERARREALATGGPYPNGTRTVEGEVVTVKSREGYAGRTAWKMLVVLSTGHKAWGTVPEKLWDAANDLSTDEAPVRVEDLRVRFTANFEVSDDDSAFGFFKSPKKVEVLGLREGVTA